MRWAMAALAACGGGGATDASVTCTGPTSAALGQGETAFEALADGGEIDIVHGPQGGFHVDAAVQVEGFGATVEITGTVTDDATGTVVGGSQAAVVVVLADYDEATCAGTAVGVRLFLDDLPSEDEQVAAACAMGAGGAVALSVTVTDLESGATVTVAATGTGVLVAPSGSPCTP